MIHKRRGRKGDELAPDTFFTRHWEKKRQKQNAEGIQIRQAQGRMQVVVPYHKDWPAKARALGGRWRRRSAVWSFPIASRHIVVEALVQVFGPHGGL